MVSDNTHLVFILSLGCSARLIHGFTTDGTFAEYAVSQASYRQHDVCVLSDDFALQGCMDLLCHSYPRVAR